MDAQDARLLERLAGIFPLHESKLILGPEEDFLANSPADVDALAVSLHNQLILTRLRALLRPRWPEQLQPPKQNDIDILIIEVLCVERLTLVQIDDRAVVQDDLDGFEIELAEDGVVVVQAEVGHVDLGVGGRAGSVAAGVAPQSILGLISELLGYLEEPTFDFLLDFGPQLFLLVIHVHVLTPKVFQQS